jgi:hypothetical protein
MVTLPDSRSAWPGWAKFLRRRGWDSLVAWALEGFGPLTVLGAQAVYIGKPFLRPSLSGATLDALAQLLEDSNEAKAFADYLRKGELA